MKKQWKHISSKNDEIGKSKVYDLFKHLGIELKESEDNYAVYDLYNENLIVEVKNRSREYDSYMIDLHKYNNLVEESNRVNKLPLYISVVGNKVFILNLSKADIKFSTGNYSSKNTDFGGGEKVGKMCCNVPISKHTEYIFKSGKWFKVHSPYKIK